MHSHKMKYEYLIAREFVLKHAYTNLHQLPKLQRIVLYTPTYHVTQPTYAQQNECHPVWLHLITGQRPKLILKDKGKPAHANSGLQGFQLTLRTHTMLKCLNRLAFGVSMTLDSHSIRQQMLQQYKAVHVTHNGITRTQYTHTLNFALPHGDTRLHVNAIVSSGKKLPARMLQAQYLSALL